jgi:hypothetical protein
LGFFEGLFTQDLFKKKSIILRVYLNFTCRKVKIWGEFAKENPQVGYFLNKMEEARPIDIELVKMVCTWRNLRIGASHMAKRIDRILFSHSLLSNYDRFRTWIELGGDSYHFPFFF